MDRTALSVGVYLPMAEICTRRLSQGTFALLSTTVPANFTVREVLQDSLSQHLQHSLPQLSDCYGGKPCG
jgi:hypothetical protein